jgi:hypothetical protein
MSVLAAPVRSFAAADTRKRVDSSRTIDAIVSATHATKHIIITTSNQPPAAMICLIRQKARGQGMISPMGHSRVVCGCRSHTGPRTKQSGIPCVHMMIPIQQTCQSKADGSQTLKPLRIIIRTSVVAHGTTPSWGDDDDNGDERTATVSFGAVNCRHTGSKSWVLT